ncbi:biotin--[acetyl-CoA-carboxylase] ligase [Roseobacter sp. S98]|uniref:biotin--[acetyl-CoA-carboxylase] ligase n=1 Tax=Roseobacter algicola (ex Choi et al. 2025) (nom. illeg.) TaxID=3092138 RepID=UPI003F51175E
MNEVDANKEASKGMIHLFSKHLLEEIDSTNNYAKRLVELGEADEPIAIRAKRQTAGRGSRGRSWASFDGNVLATFVFEAPLEGRYLPQLVYSVSLAVYDTVKEVCDDQKVEIKWPNDILLNKMKVSGSLHETAYGPLGNRFVAGIGINVQHFPSTETLIPASSLAAQGCTELTAAKVFDILCDKMAKRLLQAAKKPFADIRDEVLSVSYGVGDEISVSVSGDRSDAAIGTFIGIDDDGYMLMKDQNGKTVKFSTGTIFSDLKD